MKVRTSFFPLGSSYYPPFHTPAEWEEDVANMAKAGLNTMRTAELVVPALGYCTGTVKE